MSKGEALRDRTATAIIDSAAEVMAARGAGASMHEIATAAGVSRATLYRYFPTREVLLRSMAAAAVEDLTARLAEATHPGLPVEEAVARLVRGFLAVGSRYIALSNDPTRHTDAAAEAALTGPVRALLHRGIADGTLRPGLAPDLLTALFSGLIGAALQTTTTGRAGLEETAAAVTSVFLTGTRA